MYICVCSAVTERDIRRAAANGHDSLRALRKELGVCSGCGRCAQSARDVLKDVEHESRSRNAHSLHGAALAFA